MTAAAPKATPFRKLLVANRGEIALRVMRSARALGLRTVAVYSTVDADAPHVAAADQAVCVGEALPAQSYLNVGPILDGARLAGADAVHPGYGFLAENAAFAAACREAGLVFVGPSPEAIRAMGDKAEAKRLMQQAGVPCIPGWQGDDQREDHLAAEAGRLGYPLMIKATAGGGGRGMRLVPRAADFPAALRSATSEAASAFGDRRVLLERAVVSPRHVEIQVFADRHGNAVHLGERDCSVQRRHQKLIEESPSPAVDTSLRERMGASALAAVRAIGYEGAGTLEFLLDAEGRYWFMEMNTRLQVEHPVTEAITGIDLVEWQLRVAAGEPLPLAQDEIRFAGHAIEVRLCAEDAEAGFVPQSGVLRRWQPPRGLRVEHALHDGCSVPPHYDSMIAKLVAHGRSREEARRRLLAGLEDLVALGVRTNQHFLARCLAHPTFVAGEATTAFVGEASTALAPDPLGAERARLVAAWLLHRGAHAGDGRLAPALPLERRFTLDGREQAVSVLQAAPRRFRLRDEGREHVLEAVAPDAHDGPFVLDGLRESAAWVRDGPGRLWFHHAGRAFEVVDRTHAAAVTAARAAGGDGRVRAAMNGRVVALLAAPGEAVVAGQPLVTLEAMKMQHLHAAPHAGTVRAVHVAVGEQVPAQQVLVEVEAARADVAETAS